MQSSSNMVKLMKHKYTKGVNADSSDSEEEKPYENREDDGLGEEPQVLDYVESQASIV